MRISNPITHFWSLVEVRGPEDCWLWKSDTLDKGGYGHYHLYGGRNVPAHRYAYEITFGPIPDGLCACHVCDHPSCCNPAHLFLGDNKENTRDRQSKGRGIRGERSHLAKLTAADVIEIRANYTKRPELYKNIGARYGITDGAIYRILRRKNWMWLF
jgi:hypothetical protein